MMSSPQSHVLILQLRHCKTFMSLESDKVASDPVEDQTIVRIPVQQ